MPIKVEIRMNAELMADFMVYHIFTSKRGMTAFALAALNLGFSVALAVKGNFPYAAMFFVIAVGIVLGFPKLVRTKTLKQMKASERLKEPVFYEFDEQGIRTTIGEESGKASWGKFVKAVSYQNLVIIYDPEKRAIIMPREQLASQYEAVVEMIRTHLPEGSVRIKK